MEIIIIFIGSILVVTLLVTLLLLKVINLNQKEFDKGQEIITKIVNLATEASNLKECEDILNDLITQCTSENKMFTISPPFRTSFYEIRGYLRGKISILKQLKEQ
jgi:hypothetical protein